MLVIARKNRRIDLRRMLLKASGLQELRSMSCFSLELEPVFYIIFVALNVVAYARSCARVLVVPFLLFEAHLSRSLSPSHHLLHNFHILIDLFQLLPLRSLPLSFFFFAQLLSLALFLSLFVRTSNIFRLLSIRLKTVICST